MNQNSFYAVGCLSDVSLLGQDSMLFKEKSFGNMALCFFQLRVRFIKVKPGTSVCSQIGITLQ